MKTHYAYSGAYRSTAITTLAVIGFFALIAAGVGLAIYSGRYIPDAISRVNLTAATVLSLFSPASSTLSVIPKTPNEISYSEILGVSAAAAPAPLGTADEQPEVTTTPTPKPVTQGTASSNTFVIGEGATPSPGVASSLPDLSASITSSGYLVSTSTDSFVASTTIPANTRPAIKFIVSNTGTGSTGPWRFSASIPTTSGYLFESPAQEPLAPGDRIEYILGFDQARSGTNQTIAISTDHLHIVNESNENNNGASVSVTVLGN